MPSSLASWAWSGKERAGGNSTVSSPSSSSRELGSENWGATRCFVIRCSCAPLLKLCVPCVCLIVHSQNTAPVSFSRCKVVLTLVHLFLCHLLFRQAPQKIQERVS